MKVRSLTGPERFQKNRVTNSASTSKQTRAEYPGKAVLGREAGVRKSNILNKKPRFATIFPYPPQSPGWDPGSCQLAEQVWSLNSTTIRLIRGFQTPLKYVQPITLKPKIWSAATVTAKSLQSCPTLCDPIDGRPVPGILQARTPEWVAISF